MPLAGEQHGKKQMTAQGKEKESQLQSRTVCQAEKWCIALLRNRLVLITSETPYLQLGSIRNMGRIDMTISNRSYMERPKTSIKLSSQITYTKFNASKSSRKDYVLIVRPICSRWKSHI